MLAARKREEASLARLRGAAGPPTHRHERCAQEVHVGAILDERVVAVLVERRVPGQVDVHEGRTNRDHIQAGGHVARVRSQNCRWQLQTGTRGQVVSTVDEDQLRPVVEARARERLQELDGRRLVTYARVDDKVHNPEVTARLGRVGARSDMARDLKARRLGLSKAWVIYVLRHARHSRR